MSQENSIMNKNAKKSFNWPTVAITLAWIVVILESFDRAKERNDLERAVIITNLNTDAYEDAVIYERNGTTNCYYGWRDGKAYPLEKIKQLESNEQRAEFERSFTNTYQPKE